MFCAKIARQQEIICSLDNAVTNIATILKSCCCKVEEEDTTEGLNDAVVQYEKCVM